MEQGSFYGKTRTADELNRYHRAQREKSISGAIGSDRLPKPVGELPPLSPANPGAGYAMRTSGGNRKGMIDR